METSPFNGRDGMRFDTAADGSPPGSMVFSSAFRDDNASAFISGFMRPGGDPATQVEAGLLPGIVNIQSTAGPTVNITNAGGKLSTAEQNLVARWPAFFNGFRNFMDRFGVFVYVGLFLLILAAVAKRMK